MLLKTVTTTTRDNYLRTLSHFILWLYNQTNEDMNYREILHPAFVRDMVTTGPEGEEICTTATIRSKLELMGSLNHELPPFDLETFDGSIFTTFLCSLRKKTDGSHPGAGTYAGFRTALTYLYSLFKTPISLKLASDLKSRMKGLKRTASDRISSGEGTIKVGMDPLPFDTYRFICDFWLRGASLESIFSRTFTILSWNLMCRASNTKRIHLNHISWSADAMQIYFCNMKNDQEGKQPRHPRHIYPNAYYPEICPILNLGCFWLCFHFDGNEKPLFRGDLS